MIVGVGTAKPALKNLHFLSWPRQALPSNFSLPSQDLCACQINAF